jgi:hypothetical protein
MEHRYSPRINLNMKLLLYKTGMPVAIGRIRNASHGGLYVETDFDEIRAHQALEVELLPRASTRIDRCRFRTLVARRERSGCGLEVDENCVQSRSALAALVDCMAHGAFGVYRLPY